MDVQPALVAGGTLWDFVVLGVVTSKRYIYSRKNGRMAQSESHNFMYSFAAPILRNQLAQRLLLTENGPKKNFRVYSRFIPKITSSE